MVVTKAAHVLAVVGVSAVVAAATATPARSTALVPRQAQQAPASPRDTTRATIGGATLLVDYGRPSKRGRVIFGGLEPWGRVWRTGANAATHFQTNKDLVIAGKTVPAGTYTIYTLLSETEPMLIVNKQVGQWGTAYDASQDLIRVPLRLTRLAAPVEKFTIAIEPRDRGGLMRLSWDTVEFSTPFTVR